MDPRVTAYCASCRRIEPVAQVRSVEKPRHIPGYVVNVRFGCGGDARQDQIVTSAANLAAMREYVKGRPSAGQLVNVALSAEYAKRLREHYYPEGS